MKKTKDTDYLFLSSYLQAKMAHMGENRPDKAAAYKEMQSMAPDPQIVDFFRLKYDYHNAKVYLKSVAAGTENAHLYVPLGRVLPAVLTEACRVEDYRSLPKTYAAAIKSASEVLGRTADPRLADFLLDKAYLREMQETAANTGSAFLKGYAALFADAVNLRAVVRMLKSAVRPEQLPGVLTDAGSVGANRIQSAYPDTAAVLSLYRSTPLSSALAEAEKAARGEGFSPFEKAVQAALDGYMDSAKTTCFGENVLIRYLYQMEGLHA